METRAHARGAVPRRREPRRRRATLRDARSARWPTRAEQVVLVVCHEIPVRYALNAASGSDDLDGPEHAIPNATPYLFDEQALARAARDIERITRSR